MKRFVLCLLSVSILPACVSQQETTGTALIKARQAEVAPLAKMLYGIDLRQGTWSHSQADICPAFRHHVFARYTRTDPAGSGASFIAVYDPAVPPASSLSKPWQGGILLVPFRSGGDAAALEHHGTAVVFNRILADEMRSNPELKTPDWSSLAECYISLGGEQSSKSPDADPQDHPLTPEPLPVSSVLVPLASSGTRSRAVHIGFDQRGFVTEAQVTVSPV